MLERSGKDFDPAIVKVFINMIGIFPLGTLVLLSTNEMGIVTQIQEDSELIDRPKVCLLYYSDGEYRKGKAVDLKEMDEKPIRSRGASLRPSIRMSTISTSPNLSFKSALFLSFLPFFLVPLFLTKWLRFAIPMVTESGLVFNLVDGILRLVIFSGFVPVKRRLIIY
jgi:hypothetical protein